MVGVVPVAVRFLVFPDGFPIIQLAKNRVESVIRGAQAFGNVTDMILQGGMFIFKVVLRNSQGINVSKPSPADFRADALRPGVVVLGVALRGDHPIGGGVSVVHSGTMRGRKSRKGFHRIVWLVVAH